MKYPLTTMALLLAGLLAGALPARAADLDCLQDLTQSTNREKQRAGVYIGEMKAQVGNAWATRAVSICNGALARADNYYRRMEDAEEICDSGTMYVDNQISQLYHSATSTCREQFDEVARSLSDDEQRAMRENADRALRQVK